MVCHYNIGSIISGISCLYPPATAIMNDTKNEFLCCVKYLNSFNCRFSRLSIDLSIPSRMDGCSTYLRDKQEHYCSSAMYISQLKIKVKKKKRERDERGGRVDTGGLVRLDNLYSKLSGK